MFNQVGRQSVSLTTFGGLVTEALPNALSEGSSPLCYDVDFLIGSVFSRSGLSSQFGAGVNSQNFVWVKSFIRANGQIYTLALAADGTLWQEDVTNAPGTIVQIETVMPGDKGFGSTAFNREYISLENNDVTRQYDGTNFDQVSQDGPAAPITINVSSTGNPGLAALTSYSVTSNVVTFQAVNSFSSGTPVQIAGTGVSGLDGQVLTVLASGLSSSQFEANFTSPNVSSTPIGGTATPLTNSNISSIVQQAGGTIVADDWGGGPGSRSSGQIYTIYYGTTPDANLVNLFQSGLNVYVYLTFSGGVTFTPGTYKVTSIGQGGLHNNYYYFTCQAPSIANKINSSVGNYGTYQVTMATVTLSSPLPGIIQGNQVNIAGATPSSWNNAWTVVQTPNGGVLNITQTAISGGTATYTFTVQSGSGPVTGDLITITGTNNANGVLNQSNAIIANVVGSTFTITGFNPALTFGTTAETGIAQTTGRTFLIDPGPLFVGQSNANSPIFGNDSGSGSVTVTNTTLNVAAGTRQACVLFLTRNGYLTRPSPPVTFTIPANTSSINASNIPVGPPNVIARWIAFTEAGANGVPGAYFYVIPTPVNTIVNGQPYTFQPTVINDNTSTSASFSFTDAVLLSALEIDIPGGNQFNMNVLGSSAWNINYKNRMFYGGVNNKVNNFLNMYFDGGYIPNAGQGQGGGSAPTPAFTGTSSVSGGSAHGSITNTVAVQPNAVINVGDEQVLMINCVNGQDAGLPSINTIVDALGQVWSPLATQNQFLDQFGQGQSFVVYTTQANAAAAAKVASITSTSVSSNVLTVLAPNSFSPGDQIEFFNVANSTFLNGQIFTIASASSTQFTANFTHGNYGPTADTGQACGTWNITITSTVGTGATIQNFAYWGNVAMGAFSLTFTSTPVHASSGTGLNGGSHAYVPNQVVLAFAWAGSTITAIPTSTTFFVGNSGSQNMQAVRFATGGGSGTFNDTWTQTSSNPSVTLYAIFTQASFSGQLPTPFAPLGWTADANFGNGGCLIVSSVFGNSYYVQNVSGSTQSFYGMITQPAFVDAYQAPIILPNTAYSARIAARIPSGGTTGNLVLDLVTFNPSNQTYGPSLGSFTIPFSSLSTTISVQVGTLLTTLLPTVPSTLVLRLYTTNIANLADVEVDRIEVYPTQTPTLTTTLVASYANNPEAFDGITGLLNVAQTNTQPVNGAFVMYDQLYLLKQSSLSSTQDTPGSEPSGWNVAEVSNVVGAVGKYAYDVGEEWAVIAARSGLYVFYGKQPIKISQEIFQVWEAINWNAASTIWVKNDVVNRRILIGVPMATGAGTKSFPYLPNAPTVSNPTSPNVILMLNYLGLGDVMALGDGEQMHTTMFGTLMSVDMRRKWTIWNVTSPYGDFIMRQDGVTTQLMLGNGVGNGKIYSFSPTQLTDDGTTINALYTTYGFVDENKKQQNPLLGNHRKQYVYSQMTIQGTGQVSLTLLSNQLTPPQSGYSYTTPPITLSANPTDDLERPVNAQGNRVFAQFKTVGSGSAFTLQKLILVGSQAMLPLRGSAAQ